MDPVFHVDSSNVAAALRAAQLPAPPKKKIASRLKKADVGTHSEIVKRELFDQDVDMPVAVV